MRRFKAMLGVALAVATIFAAVALASCASFGPRGAAKLGSPRQAIPLDAGWRWAKGDVPGAEAPGFNAAAWATEDLPNDWAIAGPVDKNAPTDRGGGYMPSGASWHRKSFALPAADRGKRVFVDFDGVIGLADAWINGFHLGRHAYSYSSFQYELTDHLKFGGASNVLAVKADATRQPASRWYTGQGIYRHVRLEVAEPVHFANWGVFVTTPKASAEQAVVRVEATFVNQSAAPASVFAAVQLRAPDGKPAGEGDSETVTVAPGAKTTVGVRIAVAHPRLWDVNDPAMHKAAVLLVANGKTTDAQVVPFGVRSAEFRADTGFWLNGKNIKLQGACLHHDAGALGAAVPLEAWRRRLQGLKDLGVNALRLAHNPPAPEFLDLCDRMGMMVMLETFDTWTAAKKHAEKAYNVDFKKNWQSDLTEVIKRDRNHPSIVIYSAGNEIRDGLGKPAGRERFLAQRDLIKGLDPTRPITMALFRPKGQGLYKNGFAELLDVVGENYHNDELIALHKAKPGLKVIDTEEKHDPEQWRIVRDAPFIAGMFLWTGVDYLGEADWPAIAHGDALLDRTGEPRVLGLQRESFWSAKPVVHLARLGGVGGMADDPADTDNTQNRQAVKYHDWSPANATLGEAVAVEAYSNCDEVELFLNGKSLGAKPAPETLEPRAWSVPYADGELKAIGRDGGKAVAEETLRTAGKPAKIVLSTDHARPLANAFDDVAYVTATVVDAQGVRVPGAGELVTFQVEGPGAIVAVDNSNLKSHEPYRSNRRRAYDGRCVAIVRSTASPGEIVVKASADGLQGSALTIEAAPPVARP